MRSRLALPILGSLLVFGAEAAAGQSCTGLACQQQACTGNQTTSISGVVYAPNGTDPLPNVTVYVPNATVDAFTPGVSCPLAGAAPSGSPLVGTITNVDGTFTIQNMPVGANIPLVIISGRWRRQLTIPSVAACQNTALTNDFAVMPKNQSEGDIPKIAIATGSVDQVECVLRKVGISDSEFTDSTGSGRINIYTGNHSSGARIDASTPTENSLMDNYSVLSQYDVLMLPCQGSAITEKAQDLANLIQFANSGGRVYASHYSYDWMYHNPPFDGVANWSPDQASLNSGTATVNTSFTAGQTLSNWLQLPAINASVAPGQMTLNTLRVDTKGVNAPTKDWLDLNNSQYNNPTMQFVFDTPIVATGSGVNQCGRVLFNEYHVENGSSSAAQNFPSECTTGAMTPQEKLLEYMLFELTAEGGQPSLDPTTKDFGSMAVGFTSAPQTFTWTNNSSFPVQVTSALLTGSNDFSITSNNCSAVAAGTSCQIVVVFKPTALGAESGTLTVQSSGGNQLTSTLKGTGTPGFTLSGSSLSYGNLDIGNSSSQTLTLTNISTGALPVPPFVVGGQYKLDTSACGSSVAAGAQCAIKITFLPTSTGQQNGTLGVNSTSLLYNGLTATLSGNGVDFTLTINPTSGHVIAGNPITSVATLTPIAGFSSAVNVSCTVATAATAASCSTGSTSLTPPGTVSVTISTTSQYTVIGYGMGASGYLWLLGIASGCLLWYRRRDAIALRRALVFDVVTGIVGFVVTGCSGKLPAKNAAYTGPGTYTVTVSGTDGFLVRTATFTLNVTAN